MSEQKAVFGIDLGTTNSTIARFSEGVFSAIPIGGTPLVPSVVAHDGKDFLVGRAALNYGYLHPDKAVFSIKRRMGDASWQTALGGESLSPEKISARILSHLKLNAAEALQTEITEAVVTVPAYFGDAQRRATLAAGELAGLKVLRIINEPTAAALAYDVATTGAHKGETAPGKWLVYDLGGGTFDVSVLSVSKDYKEVQASTGNCWLGGDDFDRKLVEWLSDRVKEDHGINVAEDPLCLARLKVIAEQAKIRLSTDVEVLVRESLVHVAGRFEINLVLTREIFESLIGELLHSTMAKVRQCLEEAAVLPREISRLLLVGGSTRIPLVRELLEAEFRLEPDAFIDPDLSVALGASVQSALATGASFSNIVVDVSPHTLGIAAVGEEDYSQWYRDDNYDDESGGHPDSDGLHRIRVRHPKTFSPIIRRNSKLPARFMKEFYTSTDDQKSVEVAVYQGEAKRTTDNALVGAFFAPLEARSAHSPIRIGFEYDLNGVIRVMVEQSGVSGSRAAHVMDLKQSARLNSSADVLTRHEHDYDAGVGFDQPADNVPGISAQKVLNILVKRVEEELHSIEDAAQVGRIRSLLDRYRQALAAGDDAQADGLEDELYGWLEERD